MFDDAPTEERQSHLQQACCLLFSGLAKAVQSGFRPDFSPNMFHHEDQKNTKSGQLVLSFVDFAPFVVEK